MSLHFLLDSHKSGGLSRQALRWWEPSSRLCLDVCDRLLQQYREADSAHAMNELSLVIGFV